MLAHAFNPSTQGGTGRGISVVFEASLVYRASSRTDRSVTHRNPFLKNKMMTNGDTTTNNSSGRYSGLQITKLAKVLISALALQSYSSLTLLALRHFMAHIPCNLAHRLPCGSSLISVCGLFLLSLPHSYNDQGTELKKMMG